MGERDQWCGLCVIGKCRKASFNVTEDRADARDQASNLYTGIPGGSTFMDLGGKNYSVNGFSVTGILGKSFNCVVGQGRLTLRIFRS